MEKTSVVITGSTRGLGLCLAREFTSRGAAVMVSGRTPEAVERAVSLLAQEQPGTTVHGLACDVRNPSEVQGLWNKAEGLFGKIDHWINNAGIGQAMQTIWDLDAESMEDVLQTNVLGSLLGARAAMHGMMKHSAGAIWFMEGHGSDGSIRKGLSVYGASKRAIRYIARACAREAEGSGILIGALSPGLMITDFTMSRIDRSDPEQWKRTRKIFNIIADRPETVASFLAPRILSATKNGTRIAWLTTPKIICRFMTAGIVKRRVIEE